MLTLRIEIVDLSVTKTINFKPTILVHDACQIIRDKVPDALALADAKNYGLFYTKEDRQSGIWLEMGKSLEHYVLRNGDTLEYKNKIRTLKVRMLDDSVKTLQVDDSHTVAQIMITICSKIGITNHEEYSLVREWSEEEKMKTMTMKRDKSIAKNQKKMDEMKRKLHTDDELGWLDPKKSLLEQDIDEKATLLLRRKYFFSDQNIDARDPIQLHLLYVQTRDNIMKGALPVSQENAVEFAGLQCQIQYGDYNESKHKPGFLELKEVLPKEYRRNKGIEKKIYIEQSKLKGMDELSAKAKYTQLARSLPTYGIAFFLVKEKVKGKNKLSPTLLGVTKESIVKIDNEKKEIVKTWPLTTVKRWAPTPNTFNLDFGDYADSCYCVQTLEGEKIAQLISGYIDIILKKKQAQDYVGFEGDEESTMYEDSVCPAKATIIQHQSAGKGQAMTGNVALPAVLRSGDSNSTAAAHQMQQAMHSNVSQLSHLGHRLPMGQNAGSVGFAGAQRALMGRIGEGLEASKEAKNQLNYKANLPVLGNDPGSRKWREMSADNSRQRLNAQMSLLNTATAQIVLQTANQPNSDFTALASAVQTISSNMGNFSRDVKLLAALDEEDGLLGAARSLVDAFSGLLEAAQSSSTEPRQKLLNAANKVGESGEEVMRHVDQEDNDAILKERLMAAARHVASCASELVRQAKSVSSTCENKDEQNAVVEAATTCALSSSQLVACGRVLAVTIDEPQCKEQLVQAAKTVATSVNDVVGVSEQVCRDEGVLGSLKHSAHNVTTALEQLMNMLHSGYNRADGVDQVDSIMVTTERLCNNSSNTQEVVRQTKSLAQATSSLVTSLKQEAEIQHDSDQQNKLLSAAKLLADATARMVDAAKGCASQPGNEVCRGVLKEAAHELRSAAVFAANGAFKTSMLNELQYAAKKATSAATQLVYAADTASEFNSSQQNQQQLNSLCGLVSEEIIPKVNQALRQSHKEAHSSEALNNLSNAGHEFLQPCSKLVSSTKAALPTITDQSSSLLLNNALKNLSNSIADLKSCLGRAKQACSSDSAFDACMQQIEGIQQELEETKKTAKLGQLVVLPGESPSGTSHRLGSAARDVATSIAQLLNAATQKNESEAGKCSMEVAESLKNFSTSLRGVAATNKETGLDAIERGIDVVGKASSVVQQARVLLAEPDNVEAKNKLAMATKVTSQALTSCVACLPGVKEVEKAASKVNEASHKINSINQNTHNGFGVTYKGTECNLHEIQLNVHNTASELSQTTQDLLQACQTADKDINVVSTKSNKLAKAYEDLIEEAVDMAAMTKDGSVRSAMLDGLHGVSNTTKRFLAASKCLLGDPDSSASMLNQAARQVSDSINQLISIFTVASPSQKQCDNAIRNINSLKMIRNDLPLNQASYNECLDTVIQQSKNLAVPMSKIPSVADKEFCLAVTAFEDCIVSMIEHTAQATFLAGVGSEGSKEGSAGIIDQAQVVQAAEAIEEACGVLARPVTHQQMLGAVSIIANQTSSLCNACRHASNRTEQASYKAAFVQHAKDLANNTASMVRSMKACSEGSIEERQEVGKKTGTALLECLQNLTSFVQSPRFAPTAAQMSSEGLKVQEPLRKAFDDIITHSTAMLEASKSINSNSTDGRSQYSHHSHELSQALKSLLSSLRRQQPGVKECDSSLVEIDQLIKDVDDISLETRDISSYASDVSTEVCHEQAVNSVKQVRSLVEPLQMAAKSGANVGHLVKAVTSYMSPFKSSLLAVVAKSLDSRQQTDLVTQCKTVAESLHNLILLSKEATTQSRNDDLHLQVDEAAEECKDNIDTMLHTLTTTASNSGVVTSLLEQIDRSIALVTEANLDEVISNDPESSFAEHQTNIVNYLKQLAKTAQEMNIRTVTNSTQDLGALANTLAQQYNCLAIEAAKASLVCSSEQTAFRLKSCTRQLGVHLHSLVQTAGAIASSPNDQFARKELDKHVKKIHEDVTESIGLLQWSAKGTQACISACSTLSGIMADLETSIMFASASTLTSEPNDSFANYREEILTTAKDLVDDTKKLVAGAAMNQEELAGAATKAVCSVELLSDRIKKAAASLGVDQNEAQVLLMHAAKDVAAALNELIGVTKMAAGKPQKHPVMESLKEAAKVMVTNVTSLLKTVKTVEDDAMMASQAVESTIEAINQEIKAYCSSDRSEESISPDQVIQATRPVAFATSKAVAAANSGRQDDMIVASNLGRRTISELLRHCRGGVVGVEDEDLKARLLQGGLNCSEAFKQLLILVQLRGQNLEADQKQRVATASKRIAMAVTEVVQAAEAIKGVDWIDPQDPTVIAEAELLSAANSIEAAARKLTTLQPKLKPKQADETLTFEEQLLQAAKSITTATSALVRAASSAQKELTMQGRIGQTSDDIDSDSQWSQGLISAAKLVALATHTLCDAANAMVQGHASEERLISAAKQVASSTAQLLLACKVKASPNSQAMRRLQTAGHAVKRATEALVREAQGFKEEEEEDGVQVSVNNKMVTDMAQMIMAQEEIFRKEKELLNARKKLETIRKAKYRHDGVEED